MSAERAAAIACCQLVDQALPDYTALLARYPLLADEPLYLLGEVDEDQKAQLSAILSKPR